MGVLGRLTAMGVLRNVEGRPARRGQVPRRLVDDVNRRPKAEQTGPDKSESTQVSEPIDRFMTAITRGDLSPSRLVEPVEPPGGWTYRDGRTFFTTASLISLSWASWSAVSRSMRFRRTAPT